MDEQHTPFTRPSRRGIPLPAPPPSAFRPVPVGSRRDGWTAQRRADFIGYLARTPSVQEACACIGMGREGAHRLRRRPSVAGFAAAWDAAIGKPHSRIDLGSAKATGLPASGRFEQGLIAIVLYRGRYCASPRKADNPALPEHLAAMEGGGHEWAFQAHLDAAR